ncbi:MAG: NAD(P)H-hydrate dehydratase [Synechococcaceae cyanobacterium]
MPIERPPRNAPSRHEWPPRDAEHLLVTSAVMAELEASLFASGLPVEALMEKAALAVSRRLLQGLGDRPSPARQADAVVVLVGPGHNGGDGLVVARELFLAGVSVRIWCPFERLKPLTEAHRRHARWLGIPELAAPPEPEDSSLWIDALFGIGQNRAPGEALQALLAERQRQRPGALEAIDVPTGLCADRGRPLGASAATARRTWCLGLIKQGLVQDTALRWVGQLERIDLGFPPQLLHGLDWQTPIGLWPKDQREAPRPRPDPATAKYGRGRLLVVAGSQRYLGAAHLALLGASASGCGSLRAALPPELAASLWQVMPHVVVEPPDQANIDGRVRLANLAETWLERLDAVLIGPGIGPDPQGSAEQARWQQLAGFGGLVLLDADGLNRLALGAAGGRALEWLRQRRGPTWLTPHAGEFGRLFPALAEWPPLRAAREAAGLSGAAVLLKGARSVVAAPDGTTWQMLAASAAAARAGLGDVLAGYAAAHGALLGAAMATIEATHLAVAVLDHALAGCRAERRWGAGGATPMAVAAELGAVLAGPCEEIDTIAAVGGRGKGCQN